MNFHWTVLRLLGHGSSGSVFEVREVGGQNRRAALKVHRGKSVRATEADFNREIDFVEAQRIPGFMPAFYDRGTFEDDICYVMELGKELPDKLPRKQLVAVIDRVAEALECLDAEGIIYGDVKPNNIALIRGKAVLLDFGSVRTRREQAASPLAIGTPFYRAPEIVRGESSTRLSDIYSLGITLGELCRDQDACVFASLLQHATATDPKDRPQSFTAFRRELLACEAGFRRAAAAETRLARFATVTKRIAYVIVAIMIACGCIAYVSFKDRQRLLAEKFQDTIDAQIRLRTVPPTSP